MKMKLAVYKHEYSDGSPCGEWAETCNGYVRLTEFVEVDFPPLADATVIARQVEMIDRQISKVRVAAADEVARLEQRKAELLALPAPEVTK